ncbi:MAG TPA: hypothetical protein VIW24_09795 [Aldersonia sp.]
MSTGERTDSGLRRIAAPFVVTPAKGVRTRTRVRPTASEGAALERIGVFLGALNRQALASRVRLGRVAGHEQAAWRTTEKRRLTALSSSRWAGALTRTAIDSYHLGMRGLSAEAASLRAAIQTIGSRMAAPVAGRGANPGCPPATRVRGYATEGERFAKSRRKTQLEQRLADVAERLEAGHPRIVVGGGRLWRRRHHLDEAAMSVPEWEQRWSDERMFLTADGESGKRFGNETIRVTDGGVLEIKVPAALAADLGTDRLRIGTPVSSATTHRGAEWAERIEQNLAIRYDLHRDARGRWYLDASWGYPETPTVPLDALQARRTLGVDLNAGHVDAAVVDAHGNVVGTPRRLDHTIDGSTGHRDAQVRHVVTRLIHAAGRAGCASISIENLGFADARATGRETMGRGRRGKRFRRTVTGLPTAKFRDRLVAMSATAGLAVIAVDPAYTSRWGTQHWLPALKTSDPTVDAHRAAAVVIGRRSLGHRARRKPVGPHTRQRTRAGHSTGTVVRGNRTSRSRVTGRPRAHDAAGPPDP